MTVYATLYKTLPVIEWTVWLENTSDANTGIITEFYGLTDTFGQSDDGDYKLLTFKGSRQATTSFAPTLRSLEEGKTISPVGLARQAEHRLVALLQPAVEQQGRGLGQAGCVLLGRLVGPVVLRHHQNRRRRGCDRGPAGAQYLPGAGRKSCARR